MVCVVVAVVSLLSGLAACGSGAPSFGELSRGMDFVPRAGEVGIVGSQRESLEVLELDGMLVQVVVVDDEPDDVEFVDVEEVVEDDLEVGEVTPLETELELDAKQLVTALPQNKLQDDMVQMSPCSLWTVWNEEQCISRSQFRLDFDKLGRRLARKGIMKAQADIIMNEYMLRLRNAWMPGTVGMCDINWLEDAERTKCLVENDARLMGYLLGALAEAYPATSSGRLRQNPHNFARDSKKCCHRVCNAVSNLYTNTDLVRSTCCNVAPSKCFSYYP